MIRACFAALLSHWRRNPVQLFAFLAGLALATGLWSGVQAINSEARASYDAAANTLGEGQYDQLVPRRGDAISVDTYVALRRAGWLVSPVVETTLNGVRVIGIDPLTSPLAATAFAQAGAGGMGRLDALFANAETAAGLSGLVDVVVDPSIGHGLAMGDVGLVLRLAERDTLTRLMVLPDQPFAQTDRPALPPELKRQASQQTADIAQLTDSFHLNLTAFGLLSFAVGLFIVHSTIGLAFEQRRGMIRTLRSLGVPMRLLVTVICVEMMTLAALGAVVGIVLGYVIAALLLPDVAATLKGLYGADVSGTLAVRPEWWLTGFLLAMFGTAAALASRLWDIARMPLLASARPRAWVMASGVRLRAQTGAALGLLGAAGLLALLADGLLAAFALLACLLIGAALALPAVTSWMLGRFERVTTTPVWRWFWADTRQQLPGLSLALMALLLAVSANIGVSTMVSSFRLTFVGFLDQRLAPELFVRVETEAQSVALMDYLEDRDLETLPLLSVPGEAAGLPVRLFGIRVGPTYRDDWVFLDASPDAWDRVERGEAAVINEQLARRSDLWIGDEVAVDGADPLPIAGIVGDYGNPQGQVVIAADMFGTLHPDVFPTQFGIRTDNASALRTDLVRALDLTDSDITDQAAIKAVSLDVFERTFTVTAALNVLTLGVAGFAILMSLLTLADLRVPQLAPVWALGLTRARLGQLELLRAVALSALVFVCALPLGLALAWVLLSVVNVEAFGWRLPMFLFPVDYARLGAYALAAAGLAAAWPARRLMRVPPAVLLKVFANER
ncbi:ABC transporter permease [uncultured Tateyamaria sp.]|uniref:ABC transporter permease n=1 Tax=uncultured Tateyamaria sp. TaxID=455651 RepID=UPI0026157BF3|nr:ABC transporter permease [uncultured Tateyamaria sp.]